MSPVCCVSMLLHKVRIGGARIFINNISEYFFEFVKRTQWLHIVAVIMFSVTLERKYVRLLEVCLQQQVIFDSVNSSVYSQNVRGGESAQ